MRGISVFILLFCIKNYCLGQPGDFILLKKNNRTVATYFAGSKIAFTTRGGAYIEADIIQIKNDSLFLIETIVKQVPTSLGFFMLDTIARYHLQYHYNQVKAIGRTGRKFSMSASGGALIVGGVLLSVASSVVYLVDKEKFSPALLIAGLSAIGVGYLLNKLTGKGIVIGKRYSLVYIAASAQPKN